VPGFELVVELAGRDEDDVVLDLVNEAMLFGDSP